MPLSYNIIKKQRVDSKVENFEIPVIPKEGLNPSFDDRERIDPTQENISREMLNQAEAKAKIIIQGAEKQAMNITKAAREDGYKMGLEEGYNQGLEKARAETSQLKADAKALLHAAHGESRKYIKNAEEEILELSCAIAENIVHFSIDNRDENIIEMVKNALKHAEEKKQIIIRCHPESVLSLQANLYQFTNICPNASFTLLGDKERRNNDCIIETEEQVIDLDIKKQLENIATTLLEIGEEDGC